MLKIYGSRTQNKEATPVLDEHLVGLANGVAAVGAIVFGAKKQQQWNTEIWAELERNGLTLISLTPKNSVEPCPGADCPLTIGNF
mgnify:CR=1 FL=1